MTSPGASSRLEKDKFKELCEAVLDVLYKFGFSDSELEKNSLDDIGQMHIRIFRPLPNQNLSGTKAVQITIRQDGLIECGGLGTNDLEQVKGWLNKLYGTGI